MTEPTTTALVRASAEAKSDALEHARDLAQWVSLTTNAIEVLPLETSTDEEQAAALARELRAAKRRADDAKSKILAPFKAITTEIEGIFKAGIREIDALDARLRVRLAEASAARRKRIEEAARAAREAAEEANRALQAAALAPTPSEAQEAEQEARDALDGVRDALAASRDAVATAPKGVHVRVSWDFEVIDVAAVPRHFLTVDPKAVRAFLAAQPKPAEGAEPPAIAGLRWTRKETTVIR